MKTIKLYQHTCHENNKYYN